jgi:hypothetical protein
VTSITGESPERHAGESSRGGADAFTLSFWLRSGWRASLARG